MNRKNLLILFFTFAFAVGALWVWNLIEARSTNAQTASLIESITTGGPRLAACTVCKKEVSSEANACPHCGQPR